MRLLTRIFLGIPAMLVAGICWSIIQVFDPRGCAKILIKTGSLMLDQDAYDKEDMQWAMNKGFDLKKKGAYLCNLDHCIKKADRKFSVFDHRQAGKNKNKL
jgi:hypothetical protein